MASSVVGGVGCTSFRLTFESWLSSPSSLSSTWRPRLTTAPVRPASRAARQLGVTRTREPTSRDMRAVSFTMAAARGVNSSDGGCAAGETGISRGWSKLKSLHFKAICPTQGRNIPATVSRPRLQPRLSRAPPSASYLSYVRGRPPRPSYARLAPRQPHQPPAGARQISCRVRPAPTESRRPSRRGRSRGGACPRRRSRR